MPVIGYITFYQPFLTIISNSYSSEIQDLQFQRHVWMANLFSKAKHWKVFASNWRNGTITDDEIELTNCQIPVTEVYIMPCGYKVCFPLGKPPASVGSNTQTVASFKKNFRALNKKLDDYRQKLIEADARSAELIKPMLRGRDISTYGITGFEYLIGTFPSLKLNIENYPAIKEY